MDDVGPQEMLEYVHKYGQSPVAIYSGTSIGVAGVVEYGRTESHIHTCWCHIDGCLDVWYATKCGIEN